MIRNVRIDEITIPPAHRTPRNVERLAESIQATTLLHPIVVSRSLELIAGGNRLAAFRLLGRTEIPANVVNLDELDAELAEIDENIIRNEPTVLEHAELLARRKEIYEAKYPETRHVSERGGPGRGHKKTDENNAPVSFTSDTAAKLNVAPRTIQQEIQIAESITEEAKELIRGTDLEDHKAELLQIARLPEEEQKEVVEAVVKGEAKNVAEAIEHKDAAVSDAFKAALLEEILAVDDGDDEQGGGEEEGREPARPFSLANGHSTTATATKQAKSQKADDPEEAAERWIDHIQSAFNIISSLERRGGVKSLTRRWSREKREHFADRFRDLIERYEAIIGQIEETLK